jgi:hypothetical protein
LFNNIYCLIMFYFILFHLNLLMLVGHMSDKCLISAQLCGGDLRRPPLPLRGAILMYSDSANR